MTINLNKGNHFFFIHWGKWTRTGAVISSHCLRPIDLTWKARWKRIGKCSCALANRQAGELMMVRHQGVARGCYTRADMAGSPHLPEDRAPPLLLTMEALALAAWSGQRTSSRRWWWSWWWTMFTEHLMISENLTDWYKGNCDKTLSLQSFEELAQREDLKDSYLMGEFDVIKVQYQKYIGYMHTIMIRCDQGSSFRLQICLLAEAARRQRGQDPCWQDDRQLRHSSWWWWLWWWGWWGWWGWWWCLRWSRWWLWWWWWYERSLWSLMFCLRWHWHSELEEMYHQD